MKAYGPGDPDWTEGASISNRRTVIWSKPVMHDEWVSLVIGINLSRDKSEGYVEIWFNGVKQNLNNSDYNEYTVDISSDGTRAYHKTMDGTVVYPKWGSYNSNACNFETNTYYHDMRIATSMAEAQPEGVETGQNSHDFRCSSGDENLFNARDKFIDSCVDYVRADCDLISLTSTPWWVCSSDPVDASTVWTIPGSRIEAENYHRAHDSNIENLGGEYRSDGVDIELTQDTGGEYNIGWTSQGEYLTYDIAVESTGEYTLVLRQASIHSTARVSVIINGEYHANAHALENTGDWQSYTSIRIPLGELAQGIYSLTLVVETGGFNLNWLNIVADNNNGDQEETLTTITPNPESEPSEDCRSYSEGTRQEIDLSTSTCIEFDFETTGKTLQFWDSDDNTSCDYRGEVTSINGSGEITIDANYQFSQNFSGTQLHFDASNNCDQLKIRAF